jgi:hypothetical protein
MSKRSVSDRLREQAYSRQAHQETADLIVAAQEIENLRSALQDLVDNLMYVRVSTGVCMCGDPMENHSPFHGHAPVDMGAHYTDNAVTRAIELLDREE